MTIQPEMSAKSQTVHQERGQGHPAGHHEIAPRTEAVYLAAAVNSLTALLACTSFVSKYTLVIGRLVQARFNRTKPNEPEINRIADNLYKVITSEQ